jgi:ABC-type lipoprotein export system ATPase subunit
MITHDRGIASHADMLYRLAWGTLAQESL